MQRQELRLNERVLICFHGQFDCALRCAPNFFLFGFSGGHNDSGTGFKNRVGASGVVSFGGCLPAVEVEAQSGYRADVWHRLCSTGSFAAACVTEPVSESQPDCLHHVVERCQRRRHGTALPLVMFDVAVTAIIDDIQVTTKKALNAI